MTERERYILETDIKLWNAASKIMSDINDSNDEDALNIAEEAIEQLEELKEKVENENGFKEFTENVSTIILDLKIIRLQLLTKIQEKQEFTKEFEIYKTMIF